MKLVYLIFEQQQQQQQQQKKKKNNKKNKKKNKQTYNVMSMDREVLIKAKHGC